MTKKERLADIRRRLGPYVALQSSIEPYRLCDAEIARRLVELVGIVEELAAEVEDSKKVAANSISNPFPSFQEALDAISALHTSKPSEKSSGRKSRRRS